METINKFSKMNDPTIDGKTIFETIKFKISASEHVRLKRYWRNNRLKCITEIEKEFHIFKFFSEGKGVEALNFCRLVEAERALIRTFLKNKCKVWAIQDAPLRSYKQLKNEISRVGNRKNFSILQKFQLPMVSCAPAQRQVAVHS